MSASDLAAAFAGYAQKYCTARSDGNSSYITREAFSWSLRAAGELFAAISADRRHAQVTLIINGPIAKRALAGWSMGYTKIDDAELATLPGLNDFFSGGRVLAEGQHGRSKKLLEAFAQGRWRA